MKLLTDFFPVILFFVAFKFKGIYVATGVAIAASVVQIGWLLLRKKKVEPMMWFSLVIIGVFGGATLFFHNETFIKIKPTILYGLFSVALIGGQLLFGKNPMKAMLGKQMVLADAVWQKVNISWGVFFALLGCVNLLVAFHFSTDIWVNFKLFGIMGLLVVFAIGQAVVFGMVSPKTDKAE